jgi:hypothetical protein
MMRLALKNGFGVGMTEAEEKFDGILDEIEVLSGSLGSTRFGCDHGKPKRENHRFLWFPN